MGKAKYLLWVPVPLLLYWALKDIRFRDLPLTLGELTPVELMVLLAVNLLFVTVLTLRWSTILRGLGAALTILPLMTYRLAGYAVSYLTPGPQFGGEPLQLYLAKERSKVGYDIGSASILLDKTFELLGNFAFLGLATLTAVPPCALGPGRYGPALLLPCLLLILPAAYLTAVFFGIRPLYRIVQRFPRRVQAAAWLKRVTALLERSETRIVAYCHRRGSTLFQLFLFFFLVWGISSAEMWLALHFFGIEADLRQTLFILAGARFAFLLPFPAALGALELTYVAVFRLLDYSPEAALSLVLYMRARDLLFAAAGLLSVLGVLRKRGQISS